MGTDRAVGESSWSVLRLGWGRELGTGWGRDSGSTVDAQSGETGVHSVGSSRRRKVSAVTENPVDPSDSGRTKQNVLGLLI